MIFDTVYYIIHIFRGFTYRTTASDFARWPFSGQVDIPTCRCSELFVFRKVIFTTRKSMKVHYTERILSRRVIILKYFLKKIFWRVIIRIFFSKIPKRHYSERSFFFRTAVIMKVHFSEIWNNDLSK